MSDEFGPNPFQPADGGSPPRLVGRSDLVDRFGRGLDQPGSLERMTMYTGPRGMGKTVMLDEVRDLAEQRGWRVVAENALDPGLVDRLTNVRLPRLMGDYAKRDRNYRVKNVSAVGIGVGWESEERFPGGADLRSRIEEATGLIAKDGAGLLITVDELHKADPNDIRRLGAALQHCVREDRPVAFASAGLPMLTDDVLIQDPMLQSLRHGDRVELGMLKRSEVAEAIALPFQDAGRRIAPDALDVAVDGVRGYPVLTQHVGHHLWTEAGDRRDIGRRDADRAVERAIASVGVAVHDRTLSDLERADRNFLVAMAPDRGPSSMRDVAGRLGIERPEADRVRSRLLGAGLVREDRDGHLQLTLPHMRRHLQSFAPRLSNRAPVHEVNRRQRQLAAPGLDL